MCPVAFYVPDVSNHREDASWSWLQWLNLFGDGKVMTKADMFIQLEIGLADCTLPVTTDDIQHHLPFSLLVLATHLLVSKGTRQYHVL